MFFAHNTALQPPYQVLIDTNFLSHTVHHKLPLLATLMDCLYATCQPIITSCVMAEEKTTIRPCAGSSTTRSPAGLPSRRSPPRKRLGSEFR